MHEVQAHILEKIENIIHQRRHEFTPAFHHVLQSFLYYPERTPRTLFLKDNFTHWQGASRERCEDETWQTQQQTWRSGNE